MRSLKRIVLFVSILGLVTVAPILMAGKNEEVDILVAPPSVVVPKTSFNILKEEAALMYDELGLSEIGLKLEAFEYAWQGYNHLLNKGKIRTENILSICDFSQSSRKKRLYIIDVEEMKVLINTYVAHGKNSGAEYARFFSNTPSSNKSSLGFFVTTNTYYGAHGLSLKVNGVEKGINDRANARHIVIHGSNYVGDKFLKNNPFNGRSFGCPAVPERQKEEVINTIKNGTCFFIYYPSPSYIKKSTII